MLLIDVSGSLSFGSTELKRNVLTEIAAVLSFSAIQNNDKIGVIFFSDKIEKFIPPQKGKKHILKIIRELITCSPKSQKTDIKIPLQFLSNVIKKKSTVFIMSDFISDDFSKAIQIANHKHDVIAMQIHDYLESIMPAVGKILATDPETGQNFWFNSSKFTERSSYVFWWKKQQEVLRNSLLKVGVDFVSIRTDEDYIKPLLKFFKSR